MFLVLVYGSNVQLVRIDFHHSIGTECTDTWRHVFKSINSVTGFHVVGRVTIVYEEKNYRYGLQRGNEQFTIVPRLAPCQTNIVPMLGTEKYWLSQLSD